MYSNQFISLLSDQIDVWRIDGRQTGARCYARDQRGDRRANGNRANGGSTRVAPVVSPSKEEGLEEWSVVVTWAS